MIDSNWLDNAIVCGSTVWIREMIREYLPEIKELTDTPDGHAKAKEWDAKIKQVMVDRGLIEPKQQKNPITAIRNAIKTIDLNHPALEDVGISKEDWVKINDEIGDKVSERQTKYITNPQAIVDKGLELLSSNEWQDIVAGLAVLTGRRSTELLKTAQFTYKTAYSVMFTGALKRRGETQTLSFEIPTLVPAKSIIEAVTKLREWVDTSELNARQINKDYSAKVSKACDKHFSNLVPARDGKDNLYTHLFRSVYATIATHWYCPTWVPDLEFRAAIQGHYFILDEKNPKQRRNLASERHYYDYKISDGKGNIDGRVGIKLDDPEVDVLEAFQKKDSSSVEASEPVLESIPVPIPDKRTVGHYRFYDDERERLESVFERLQLKGTQQTKLSGLLQWIEQKLDESQLVDKQTEAEVEDKQAEVQSPENTWQKIDKLADVLTNLATVLVEDRVRPTRVSKVKETVAKVERAESEDGQPSVIRPKPTSGEGEVKVHEAIDAIMAYNNEPNRPYKAKWKIAISALKRLTKRNQDLIQRVMLERADEIQQHHLLHELSENQNSKGKSAPKIDEVIQLG